MSRPVRLEAALKRLSSALDQLEAAGTRLAQAGAVRSDLEDVIAAMQDDRGRLAEDLDLALHRAQTLQNAGDAVAARLAQADGVLRRLLQSGEG
jgi:hypothetical protein